MNWLYELLVKNKYACLLQYVIRVTVVPYNITETN